MAFRCISGRNWRKWYPFFLKKFSLRDTAGNSNFSTVSEKFPKCRIFIYRSIEHDERNLKIFRSLKLVENEENYVGKKKSISVTFQFFAFCAKKMYRLPNFKCPWKKFLNAGLSNGIMKNRGHVWHRGRDFISKLVHSKFTEKWLSGNLAKRNRINVSIKYSPNPELSNGTIKDITAIVEQVPV